MDYDKARTQLINYLRNEIKDSQVLSAMARVPREKFIPLEERRLSYEDRALPIGFDQTISQPFIVALMTEALELKSSDKVLEVGTGNGYQAAILAELARQVITVERLPALVQTATGILNSLGYFNISVHQAKETIGWPDTAPYDAIITTAGAPRVPPELLAQLKIGGRLVIPVGAKYTQRLYKITRKKKKNIVKDLGGCRFVSLIGKGAWEG